MVREVYDSLFFPSYLSFPLEGKSREAGKGVRGRVPIGCSIAVLTANRRPPERSDATFLHNPWHRGPTGPMDAICPSAPKAQAPAGIQESTSPTTGIYREMIHYRRVPRSFASLRMTVARQGPPILDPDLRSQPLRGCAPHHNPRAKGASNLSPLRTFGPAGRQPSRPSGLVFPSMTPRSLYPPAPRSSSLAASLARSSMA